MEDEAKALEADALVEAEVVVEEGHERGPLRRFPRLAMQQHASCGLGRLGLWRSQCLQAARMTATH